MVAERMNIAVGMTLSRVGLLPLAIIPPALGWNNGGLISAGVVLLAGLTDFADGYLARKTGRITSFGTNLDFFSDKVFVGGMLIALAWEGLISTWIPVVVLARELAVSLARFNRFHWRPPSADIWGKAKTTVSFAAIIWVALRNGLSSPGAVNSLSEHFNLEGILSAAPWVMYAAVALTIISGLNYLWKYAGKGARIKTVN
jgi:CDP-diacylglycerol--glycerol-3-phosphate 3-phosphatidyltransferase